MRENREAVERRIDEGVKIAVSRVRAPLDREVGLMKQRLEQLQARIDARRPRRKQDR
jgi:hypothetical protein